MVDSIARKIWTREGLLDVLAHEHGFYFFRFSRERGRNIVLDKGPWLFASRHLVLKKWEIGLKLSKDPMCKILVWAHFHHVPLEY